MQENLPAAIKNCITDQQIVNAAQHLKENESSVKKALDCIIPIILHSLSERMAIPTGPAAILHAAQGVNNTQAMNNNGEIHVGSKVVVTSSSELLSGWMGLDRFNKAKERVAVFSGITQKSAASLMGWVTNIVLVWLAQKSFEEVPNVIGWLKEVFRSSRKDIVSSFPASFNLSGIFNHTPQKMSDIFIDTNISDLQLHDSTNRLPRLMLPVLMLVAAALLIVYLLR